MTTSLTISMLFACQVLLPVGQNATANENSPLFERDIKPILSNKCGECHSDHTQRAALNLSHMHSLRQGGESGEELVADSLSESLLWTVIDEGEMPPSDQPQLSQDEIDLIQNWIVTGADSEQAAEKVRGVHQHDVLPIVLLRCAACHGRQLKEGGLDLRTPHSIFTGGDSGPALVAGDPDTSLMITRIESEACPPRDRLLKFFVKRPPESEVEILREWIAAGAPVVDVEPDVASLKPDPLVSSDDRQHWAFQKPTRSTAGSSIDDFIFRKLNQVGLEFSPEADRNTLIRRAYLDLLGMPPSENEWTNWRDNEEPGWYEQMLEHLLASPHYGERWGRYWLDIAGYADSEGGISADPVREVAWKYRDYVIRAFNADKPYDRFLLEQIAGDELIDHENEPEITGEIVENLVATGFLRMGIDQTGSRTMNFVPERLGVIDDAIRVLGSGVLGLTLECSRCHSHKYDAIPQRDYYRLKAIFQGALDEHDWLTFKTRKLSVSTDEHRERVVQNNPPLEKLLKRLASEHKEAIRELQLETLRQHYPDQSDADRKATLQALKIADNNRSQTQRILVEKLQSAEARREAEQPASVLEARQQVVAIEHETLTVKRELEPPLEIRALWDRGDPSPTYVLRRGEHDSPMQLVGPGVPSVLTDGTTPFGCEPPFSGKTGRRLAFARWLIEPDHPLTARVMVNRIWYHHFGRGLVTTLENFGVQGARPSHEELLDWLAVQFIECGWSIKEMHRMIMNSQTYRQSSFVADRRFELDPQNQLLSRMTLNRLDAEALRDSLLFISGMLDATPGGTPDPVSIDREGQVSIHKMATGKWRRSIYAQFRRTETPTFMDTFDYPEMGPNCVTRNVSTVSPQSLMLMNNGHVHELAGGFAQRVLNKAHNVTDQSALVETVYRMALTRPPSNEERRLGVMALADLKRQWQGDLQAALTTYCHTILNSAAFLYVD